MPMLGIEMQTQYWTHRLGLGCPHHICTNWRKEDNHIHKVSPMSIVYWCAIPWNHSRLFVRLLDWCLYSKKWLWRERWVVCGGTNRVALSHILTNERSLMNDDVSVWQCPSGLECFFVRFNSQKNREVICIKIFSLSSILWYNHVIVFS